jgi:anaerobic magnesium-protoporphyrin IX monomethyl ester cyclase
MGLQKRILLVYPLMGLSGSYVRHLPLSLLYAAIGPIEDGFEIDIVDVRLHPDSWRGEISRLISDETILAGISVMSGAPISSALLISRWLKQEFPHLPVVWGGPHVTFNGGTVLAERTVDYAVSGYGSLPLARLARHLRGDAGALPPEGIAGLSFRDGGSGGVLNVPQDDVHEIVDYRRIPYHLVEGDLHRYGQLETPERIFPMYSAMGCPYRCSFCSSPAQYRRIRERYSPLLPQDVADHIEYVHRRYDASYIYFIDDDSFVNLNHVEAIIDEILRRGIRVKLGFRGARVNEILKMDDAYLAKLAAAGTNILHIGAESGSQRMLDLMHKDCTVADIIAVNRKLARHAGITAAYNWLIGLPGETPDDLRDTCGLILQLIEDNSSAIMFSPNKYRPLPGTELYDAAIRFGYCPPESLEEWAEVENEGDFCPVWYSPRTARMIDMMQVTSYFVDDKLSKVQVGATLKYRLIRLAGLLYRPFARFRLRHGITACLVEYRLFNFLYRAVVFRPDRQQSPAGK